MEHLARIRLFNPSEIDWINVHLAWILSGEIEGCYDIIEDFADSIVKEFDLFTQKYEFPITSKVERGMKSIDQFKKLN